MNAPTKLPTTAVAALRTPSRTYVVVTRDDCNNGLYYTGKAGEAFLTRDLDEAFPYQTLEGAKRKADSLNHPSRPFDSFKPVAVMPNSDYIAEEDDYRGADAD